MNPFEAPESDLDTLRDLDVPKAISEGFRAGLRNVPGYVVFYVAMTSLTTLGCCTLVGWIPIVPAVMVGFYAYTLETIDAPRAGIATLFSGFGRFAQIFLPMWGLMILLGIANLPSFSMSFAASVTAPFLFPGDPMSQALVPSIFATVTSILWLCVIARLLLAPYYLVERGLGPVASIGAALDDSQGSWLSLAGLLALMQVVALPGIAAFSYVQVIANDLPMNAPPDVLLAKLGAVYFWYGIGALYTVVVSVLTIGMLASAYRQLSGPMRPADAR